MGACYRATSLAKQWHCWGCWACPRVCGLPGMTSPNYWHHVQACTKTTAKSRKITVTKLIFRRSCFVDSIGAEFVRRMRWALELIVLYVSAFGRCLRCFDRWRLDAVEKSSADSILRSGVCDFYFRCPRGSDGLYCVRQSFFVFMITH